MIFFAVTVVFLWIGKPSLQSWFIFRSFQVSKFQNLNDLTFRTFILSGKDIAA